MRKKVNQMLDERRGRERGREKTKRKRNAVHARIRIVFAFLSQHP